MRLQNVRRPRSPSEFVVFFASPHSPHSKNRLLFSYSRTVMYNRRFVVRTYTHARNIFYTYAAVYGVFEREKYRRKRSDASNVYAIYTCVCVYILNVYNRQKVVSVALRRI